MGRGRKPHTHKDKEEAKEEEVEGLSKEGKGKRDDGGGRKG